MKKTRYLVFLTLAALATASAASAQTRGIGLTALGDYSYTTTYGSSVGLDLLAGIPVGSQFEFEPALQFATSEVHTAAIQARTLFPLEKSSLFLKNRIVFKDVARSRTYDACLGLSLGWESTHIELEAGMFGRVMDRFGRDRHSLDAALCEPFNLLYSIKGRLRAADSPWNVWASVSNADRFQLERMWQPIISAGGWFEPSARLRLLLDVICKPSGMFHLNAEFYSIGARAGVCFKL